MARPVTAAAVWAAVLLAPRAPAATAAAVDFNRDVRPILAGRCYTCHGPDEPARKANLRLDARTEAIKPLKNGKTPIVPGKPDLSEVVRRIMTDDEDDLMPPPKAGARLTPQQVATLRAWIEQGAKYSLHWSLVKPVRPPLPAVKDATWGVNEIDAFVLARLEKEGLKPKGPADRYAIVRRLSLDLTGLPPTIAEADAFAKDDRPDACERLVDRLLASPAYGERWASPWLDLARYADSQGYAPDEDRAIWRYRDWVIAALNANLPYDRFTIEQLAGDLLPDATPAQRVATGFHRNTLTNTEGGTSDEEFRVAAVVDRVSTTMQVWMGATFACAQCHNHKYDPYTQKEFYQLFAIFNGTEDSDRKDEAPTIEVPRVGMEKEAADVAAKLAEAKKRFDAQTKQVDGGRGEWEKGIAEATKRRSEGATQARAEGGGEGGTLPKDVVAILAKPAKQRDKKEQERLTAYYRSRFPEWKKVEAEYKGLEARHKALVTTTPVMREGAPRETFVLLRGMWDAHGDKVEPGLPAAFPPPPAGQRLDRLALAKWIASPANPLTARVAVNRIWEELFGVGIVETSEEFGLQGELPSHPELLDWLATEYVRLGWDTKKLIRTIVLSAAYRQASAVPEEAARRDPYNRLISRGPRVRLSAEAVRDQALFAAGLLSRQMYGPPCQPPKPNFGLSAAFGPTTDWKADTGPERWRRAVYVRIRRNAPYPSLTTFDAPERTACTVRRIRTNTPLQALVTLNDPCYVEAAQGLARRVVGEAGPSTTERATFAFRAVLARPPTEVEVKRLVALYEQAKGAYGADRAKAEAMATRPLGPAPAGADVADLAAWTVVSNVVLNLDEALAKR